MPTTGTMRYLKIGDATYEVYDTNEDTKVYQSYKAASGYTYWRPLIIGYSSGSTETFTPADQTNLTYTFDTLKVQPSSGTIRFGAAALANGSYTNTISADTLTADRTLTAPNKSGTIALTSDISTAIAELPTPMSFKGSVGTGGTITSLPAAAAANEGYTYKVITALTTPVTAKVGDTVISNGSNWVVIPSGDEPSGTVTSVGLANATNGGLTISGSPITSSGSITVGHSNVLSSAQTTQAVYPIKIDKNGHISAYGSAVTPLTASSTLDATKLSGTIPSNCYTDTNTTYTLSNALSSHKFTSTLTAGGSGSGTSTATMEFVAGTGITLTDDTTNKKITIASSVTNTDEKLKVTNDAVDSTEYYPIFGSSSTSAETKKIDSSGFKFTTYNGTTSVTGSSILYLGNNTASGTAGNKIGYIKLYGSTKYSYTITGEALHPLADRTLTLPDKSGTIALTSDIHNVPSGGSSGQFLTKDSGADYDVTWTTPMLFGSTATKTPTEVKTALDNGYTVNIVHLDNTYGAITANNFNASAAAGVIVANVVFYYTGVGLLCFELIGNVNTDAWANNIYILAQSSDIPTVPANTSDLNNDSGFITGITSSQVIAALGYTPYNSTNPNGYTSNTGTVTKVTAGTGLSIGTTAGGNFTTSGTINHTNSVTAQTTQAVYPIKIDAQGHISAYGNAVTIPTVNNATLTIQKNGTTVNTFTANASSNVTANITVPTITDTYSGTSSNGMSGKAVKSAIDALDGTITGSAGAGKTLTAFSQTNGKVSATFENISITKSQISDFPTATKTTFTPVKGSNYSAYGGCYYKVYGSVVNLHLSVSGLTSGASANLYTLPADIRPSGYVGGTMSSGSSSTHASVTVGPDGNVNVVPVSGTYVIGDLTYII